MEKTYRVFSFQSPDFIERLMKNGIIYCYKNKRVCIRKDKYELYSNNMTIKKDTSPLYTFLRYSGLELQYPISANNISTFWTSFMRYHQLDCRHLIEMEVPADIGVIGSIEGCYLSSLEDKDTLGLEYVLPYFKKEWVREIYVKDTLDSGSVEVSVRPTLNLYEDRLFQVPFIVGNRARTSRSRAPEKEDIQQFLTLNKPIAGLSYGYNLTRLTEDECRTLVEHGIKTNFGEEIWNLEDDDEFDIYYNKLIDLIV